MNGWRRLSAANMSVSQRGGAEEGSKEGSKGRKKRRKKQENMDPMCLNLISQRVFSLSALLQLLSRCFHLLISWLRALSPAKS